MSSQLILVKIVLLASLVAFKIQDSKTAALNGKDKPACLIKWEDCMSMSGKRPTAAECDEETNKRFGCPKPKPYYRGKSTADYDLVIAREQVDTEHEEYINRLKYKKKDKEKMENTNRDRLTTKEEKSQSGSGNGGGRPSQTNNKYRNSKGPSSRPAEEIFDDGYESSESAGEKQEKSKTMYDREHEDSDRYMVEKGIDFEKDTLYKKDKTSHKKEEIYKND